jgi:hypothetical protein
MVRMIIGEAIDNIHVSLVFVDAFPDAARTLEFVQEGLFLAAARHGPTATAILKQLKEDEDYYSTISPLVSTIFSPMTFLTFFKAAGTYPTFQGQG